MPSVCLRFACAALAGGLALGAAPAEAQVEAEPKVRQVLMLQSFDRGNMTLDYFTGNFRVDLDQRTTKPVNVIQVIVGQTGFVTAPEQAVVAYIQSLFVDRPSPDILVAVAGPATLFVASIGSTSSPMRRCCSRRWISDFWTARHWPKRDGRLGRQRFSRHHRAHSAAAPRTRQVVMVMGSSATGKVLASSPRSRVQAVSRPADIRLVRRLVASGDIALLRKPSQGLGDLLLHLRHGRVGSGVCRRASAGRPLRRGECSAVRGPERVPGLWSRRRQADADGDISRSAAEVAVQILNGVAPARTRVPPHRPGQPIFDWRQLERWDIPESRLPAGSVVRYRTPSAWQQYRGTVLGAIGVLLVQSF